MPSKTKTTRSRPLNQLPLGRRAPLNRSIVLSLLVLASTVGVYYGAGMGHAATQPEIQSGVGGNLSADTPGNQCLDDHGDAAPGPNSHVDIWPCNGSPAQKASYDGTLIHVGTGCAVESGASSTVGAGSQATGRAVVVQPCTNPAPWGGAWTKSGGQFHNNHADSGGGTYCMDVSGSASEGNVILYPCKPTTSNGNERWYPGTYTDSSSGGGGGSSYGGVAILNEAIKYVGKEPEAYTLSNGEGCNCGGQTIDGGNIDTFQQLPNMAVGNPAGWCAYFVSWVYYKTGHDFGGGSGYHPIGGTDGIRAWFAARGKFYLNTAANRSHHPIQKGDFIDYDDGAHSGIADDVANGNLFSVDGNFGNNVKWDQSNSYATSGHVTGWGSLY